MTREEALAALPVQERAFLMARARGYKLRQISEASGVDIRTVAETIWRAVDMLKAKISGKQPTAPV